MSILQVGTICLLFSFYSVLLLLFAKEFVKDVRLSLLLIAPVLVFCMGFLMRLSKNQQIINTGFFFTESSVLFVSVLFTGALILGQLKYWKK